MVPINENRIPLTLIQEDFLIKKNIKLYILREDLIHPEISGNKWRKLKYNLQEAKDKGFTKLLTFGGAYSNHIAATAAAGKEFGIQTIGIIRGEGQLPLNHTLQLAKTNGMLLKYVSREQYRNKNERSFIEELKKEFGNFYRVPEGGSNALAVKGCTEIISNISIDYDIICTACGTGGTISGIIASTSHQQVIGFPALKGGDFLNEDIRKLLAEYGNQFNCKIKNANWQLITDYHFGGYARVNAELMDFIRSFNQKHDILLDFIYTGKLLFGLYDRIKKSDEYKNKTIIAVHTGGIQGNKGFWERFGITI